jgi:ribosomal protein L11 methyltransferase
LDIRCRLDDAPTIEDLPGQLAALLDDYAPTAVEELPGHAPARLAWRVFFPSPDARHAAHQGILGSPQWSGADLEPVDVPDERWAERSQADLRAVRIGRLVITPPWDLDSVSLAADDELPDPTSDPIVVVIEPSMGFGTGHHESTRLCLRALQRLDLRGRTVIDLGTGSGVLAIAAARLGSARAIAIDDDADAVEAARLNVERNAVGGRVEVRCSDLASGPLPRGEIVVANLTGGLLRRLAGAVTGCLAPGGTLVVGGFTEDEQLAVSHAFEPLAPADSCRERGWIALTLALPGIRSG